MTVLIIVMRTMTQTKKSPFALFLITEILEMKEN